MFLRPAVARLRKPEVKRLTEILVVQYGETDDIGSGDYEQEIRRAIRARGINPALFFPPHHLQSLVVGRREA